MTDSIQMPYTPKTKGKIRKGKIPATKKSPIPPSMYSLLLSIIPEAISSTATNPNNGGSI